MSLAVARQCGQRTVMPYSVAWSPRPLWAHPAGDLQRAERPHSGDGGKPVLPRQRSWIGFGCVARTTARTAMRNNAHQLLSRTNRGLRERRRYGFGCISPSLSNLVQAPSGPPRMDGCSGTSMRVRQLRQAEMFLATISARVMSGLAGKRFTAARIYRRGVAVLTGTPRTCFEDALHRGISTSPSFCPPATWRPTSGRGGLRRRTRPLDCKG